MLFSFFFFNDTATTEIYTLSLHDALPICSDLAHRDVRHQRLEVLATAALCPRQPQVPIQHADRPLDRKSTRLNSSHVRISYAVFCLKKKKTTRPVLLTFVTNYREYIAYHR